MNKIIAIMVGVSIPIAAYHLYKAMFSSNVTLFSQHNIIQDYKNDNDDCTLIPPKEIVNGNFTHVVFTDGPSSVTAKGVRATGSINVFALPANIIIDNFELASMMYKGVVSKQDDNSKMIATAVCCQRCGIHDVIVSSGTAPAICRSTNKGVVVGDGYRQLFDFRNNGVFNIIDVNGNWVIGSAVKHNCF